MMATSRKRCTAFLLSACDGRDDVHQHRRVVFSGAAAAVAFIQSCWEPIADDPDLWYWSEHFVEGGTFEVPA
jgi:hypothetical protein